MIGYVAGHDSQTSLDPFAGPALRRLAVGASDRDGEDYKIIIKDSDAATVYTLTNIVLPGSIRRATVTFTSTDPSPTIAESSHFLTAGSTAISDFDDGVVGDTINIYASADITVANNAAIVLSGDTNFYMGTGDTLILTMFVDQVWQEVGRKSAEGGAPFGTEHVSATNTLVLGERGKTVYLNNAATPFVTTLPSPQNGHRFKFIVQAAPTGGNYTIVTAGSSNIMYGTVLDIVGELVYGASQDVITFVDDTSLQGDTVTLESDGISWYYEAKSGADGGITTGQT